MADLMKIEALDNASIEGYDRGVKAERERIQKRVEKLIEEEVTALRTRSPMAMGEWKGVPAGALTLTPEHYYNIRGTLLKEILDLIIE